MGEGTPPSLIPHMYDALAKLENCTVCETFENYYSCGNTTQNIHSW